MRRKTYLGSTPEPPGAVTPDHPYQSVVSQVRKSSRCGQRRDLQIIVNIPKKELPDTWERYIENMPPIKTLAEDKFKKLRLINIVGSDQWHIAFLLVVLAEWRISNGCPTTNCSSTSL